MARRMNSRVLILASFILSSAAPALLLSGVSRAQEGQYLVVSDGTAKYSYVEEAGWQAPGFNDSIWAFVVAPSQGLCPPYSVWEGEPNPVWGTDPQEYQTIFVRKSFTVAADAKADIWAEADDDYDLYVNGELVGGNHDGWSGGDFYTGVQLQAGTNVLAMTVTDVAGDCQSVLFAVYRPCECVDNDGDGYGDPPCVNCTHGEWDCDDTNPNRNPGLPEGPFGDPSCSDSVDNDCDWYTDTEDSACCECMDDDNDGYGNPACENCVYGERDCDDTDGGVHPGVPEDCANGIDDDCNGRTDEEDEGCPCVDDDGDGYGVFCNPNCTYFSYSCYYGYAWWVLDCDDADPQVNPDAWEGPYGDPTCSDGVDNDCDGKVDAEDSACCECLDMDGDGYGDPACGNCTYSERDCNDGGGLVHPGAPEDCTNGVDDDCDGSIDGEDSDCPILAVTDSSVAENSTTVSIVLEASGRTYEYLGTTDLSSKAWVIFDEDTGYLQIPDILLRAGTFDFSYTVGFLTLTGTVEALEAEPSYYYGFWPTYVDPSDGSFSTYLDSWVTFVVSAYLGDITIAEDERLVGYPVGTLEVSGTFIARGDSDADGLNEYEATLHVPVSSSMSLGEIPPLGEVSATVSADVDLGFVAEVVSPDPYEEDDFPFDGNPLVPGEVQRHNLYPDGDVDWLEVSALEGRDYTVETFYLVGSWADTVLEVYDDTGSLVAVGDDVDPYDGRYDSRVTWSAAYAGSYYVKARGYSGSSGSFDDQGGGPAFCSYDISFACSDLDEDGYGDPGCILCTYAEADCDDTNPGVHPKASEGPPWSRSCNDGVDNDCNGMTDGEDSGCQYAGVANAEASSYGEPSLTASGSVNSLTLLVIPVCALLLLGLARRKDRDHV